MSERGKGGGQRIPWNDRNHQPRFLKMKRQERTEGQTGEDFLPKKELERTQGKKEPEGVNLISKRWRGRCQEEARVSCKEGDSS